MHLENGDAVVKFAPRLRGIPVINEHLAITVAPDGRVTQYYSTLCPLSQAEFRSASEARFPADPRAWLARSTGDLASAGLDYPSVVRATNVWQATTTEEPHACTLVPAVIAVLFDAAEGQHAALFNAVDGRLLSIRPNTGRAARLLMDTHITFLGIDPDQLCYEAEPTYACDDQPGMICARMSANPEDPDTCPYPDPYYYPRCPHCAYSCIGMGGICEWDYDVEITPHDDSRIFRVNYLFVDSWVIVRLHSEVLRLDPFGPLGFRAQLLDGSASGIRVQRAFQPPVPKGDVDRALEACGGDRRSVDWCGGLFIDRENGDLLLGVRHLVVLDPEANRCRSFRMNLETGGYECNEVPCHGT